MLIMIQALKHGRLITALRLAFYPAFEPAAKKRFEALTREAENARLAGDLARAEELYLRAMAEARVSPDPSQSYLIRWGLARVYQEQQRYREAEVIFQDQLEEAVNRPQYHTHLHAAHMCLARLYQDEGNSAKAEEHYKAAMAETEKPESERGLYCSTAMWLARFYVEQHRYSEAEPLFQRDLEIREADGTSNSSLPHHLQEFGKVYEAQKRYSAAEELYRRAVKISEELDGPKEFLIVRALDNLARFYQARGRYPEAEELSRKSLGIVEERMKSQTTESTKGWLRWPNIKRLRPGSGGLGFPSVLRSISLPRFTNVKKSMLRLSRSGDVHSKSRNKHGVKRSPGSGLTHLLRMQMRCTRSAENTKQLNLTSAWKLYARTIRKALFVSMYG